MKPTTSEMEILQVLWQKKACTVREVHESLNKKDAGYTTTLKLMQIMLEKGLVVRDSSSRTHIYTANITEEQTQTSFLDKMIDTVYHGSTSRLVMQALGHNKTSKEELAAIREYLETLEKS